MRKAKSIFSKGIGSNSYSIPDIADKPSVHNATDLAFEKELAKRSFDIDARFGQGAWEWLFKNKKKFEPQQIMDMYYMLEQLPKKQEQANAPDYNYKP